MSKKTRRKKEGIKLILLFFVSLHQLKSFHLLTLKRANLCTKRPHELKDFLNDLLILNNCNGNIRTFQHSLRKQLPLLMFEIYKIFFLKQSFRKTGPSSQTSVILLSRIDRGFLPNFIISHRVGLQNNRSVLVILDVSL